MTSAESGDRPPKMTAEQRAKRDIRVLDMFLAGATYRQIATAVGLKSHSAVHNIITRELQKSAVRRGLLTTNAAAVLIERLSRVS